MAFRVSAYAAARARFIAFLMLSFAACVPPEAGDVSTAMIGPGGGTLSLADGTSVEIPRGALSRETDVTLRRNLDAVNLTRGVSAASAVYELLPAGASIGVPIVVTIVIPDEARSTGEGIRIMAAPAGTAAFMELPTDIVEGDRARASTTQFGNIVVATRPACRGNGPCDDGSACTFNDRCVKGECRGTPYTCDDGNVCTNNVCDGAGGCRFPPNTAPCDDGNACTSNDTCANGVCSGTAYSCDDGNICTGDVCDGAGGCRFVANSASCDDGNACTSGDVCSSGRCSGTPMSCDDGNVCTDDSCNPASGCVHAANTASCDDGNACTTGDICSGGVCRGTPAGCCATYELSCTNGADDDCDGLVDRADPDCHCLSEPESSCNNGIDDDCNGLVDFEDPACVLLECTEGCPYGYGCFPDNYCHSHCEDGARDYDEGDDDCGGADCYRCAAGRRCNTGFDCASGICVNNQCQ
jgi:slime mold repeat-containing protein